MTHGKAVLPVKQFKIKIEISVKTVRLHSFFFFFLLHGPGVSISVVR
jgi:hypothetical protein